jgi:dienelactone hydrolase
MTVPHHHSHGPANRGRRVLETAAPLFLVEPGGPIRGGIVVLHDVHGLTEEIERYCRELAADGWLAVAPYHYYEAGGREYHDPDAAHAAYTERDSAQFQSDVHACIDYLTTHRGLPRQDVQVRGFGVGGQLAAWARDARNPATPTPHRSPKERS